MVEGKPCRHYFTLANRRERCRAVRTIFSFILPAAIDIATKVGASICISKLLPEGSTYNNVMADPFQRARIFHIDLEMTEKLCFQF